MTNIGATWRDIARFGGAEDNLAQCFTFAVRRLSVRPGNGCMRKNVENASPAAFYYSLEENDLLDKHRGADGGALAAPRTDGRAHFPLME